MSVITKLSCPCCGSRVTLRQIKKAEENREIKAFTFRFGGKVKGDKKGRGKAKGVCEFEETRTAGPDSLEDFWIKKLHEILNYLEDEKEIEYKDELSSDNEIELDVEENFIKQNKPKRPNKIEHEEYDDKEDNFIEDDDDERYTQNEIEIDNTIKRKRPKKHTRQDIDEDDIFEEDDNNEISTQNEIEINDDESEYETINIID